MAVLSHGLCRRLPVDDQTQRPPQLRMSHTGGHLVHQQDAHGGVALPRGVLAAGADDDIRLTGVGLRLLAALQHQVDAILSQPLRIVVGRPYPQRQARRIAPCAGALIGAVARKPQAVAGPIIVGCDRLLLHRHGGCRRADAVDKVGAAAVERHHQRVVVRRRHRQRRRVAQYRLLVPRHHGQGVRVGAVRLRIHQPPPRIHEVVGSHGAAVRPLGIRPQLERIGHGAVRRRLLRVAARHGVYRRAVRPELHQIFKYMPHHRALRRRGRHGRVDGTHRAGHDHRQSSFIVGILAAGRQQQCHAQSQQQRRHSLPDLHKATPPWGRFCAIIYVFAQKVKPSADGFTLSSFYQQLGDLHGVGGGALAYLIAAAPDIQAVFAG